MSPTHYRIATSINDSNTESHGEISERSKRRYNSLHVANRAAEKKAPGMVQDVELSFFN
jgi:uncharacterized membrane protein YkoI